MLYLIILDLFWAVSAFVYDLPKLLNLSPFLWPIVAMCPIYPLLLAIVFVQLYRKKSPNQFLVAFTSIPSVIFGILAVLYYPLAMVYQGFSWNGFGQIFWVLFYAVQGAYVFWKFKITRWPLAVVSAYMTLKFILDYKYLTFGYLDFTSMPNFVIFSLVVIGFVSLVILGLKRKKG